MPIINQPSGTVSQRNINQIIWEGNVQGATLEEMDILITQPFTGAFTVQARNNRTVFNFRGVIEQVPTVETDLFVLEGRSIRAVKTMVYSISLNNDIDIDDLTFRFVNAAYQAADGDTDVFQTSTPTILTQDIYAWNSFPIYIPAFIPVSGAVMESIDGFSFSNFTLTDPASIYIKNIGLRRSQGSYTYIVEAGGDEDSIDVQYIDRCGVDSQNLVANSDTGTFVAPLPTQLSSPDPLGTNTAVRPVPSSPSGAFGYSIPLNTYASGQIIYYTWYRRRFAVPADDAFVGDLEPMNPVNCTFGTVEQIAVDGDFERFRMPITITAGNVVTSFRMQYGDIIGTNNNTVAYWGHQISRLPVQFLRTPIPFETLNRETDFYIRWINENDAWEFWLFDKAHFLEEEPSSRGIARGVNQSTSLGTNVDNTYRLRASNLTESQYRKARKIFRSSRRELLIDNNPVALRYQEVFISGDLTTDSQRAQGVLEFEMVKQPYVNN